MDAQKAAEKDAEKAAEKAKQQADDAVRQQEEQKQPATPTPDPESAPAQDPANPAPTPEQEPSKESSEQPIPEQPTPADKQPAAPPPSDQVEQQPAVTPEAPSSSDAAPNTEKAAPALDSAKEATPPAPEVPAQDGEPSKRSQGRVEGEQGGAPAVPDDTAQPAQPPAPPPASDAEAQRLENPIRVAPVRAEEGRRVERTPRLERREGAQVLQQFDDRTVVEFNNNIYVESQDRPRLSRDAREVYYEDLPRRRTRETIVRPNGAQIITIRNRYGDVVQRSRITPDGREVILSYSPDDDREERGDWRDPGDDLPPLRLAIPVNEYIFDDPDAPEDDYYEFLAQPPVERVERTYSIDEVKRSARIRDKLRRIDLDTVTFAFGSADIAEDQVARLENVAKAMQEVLSKNPAETFLIEGHTDAVGSDRANLVLSDRRAEAVAVALTNVFEIPPENMATQGYGERYLKINVQKPEQQNRRVAIRRITPLIAPMASK
ncbi:OmpA family protein [Phyllobacterium salinisoli]|uniref:OmpA family protein n=2 Tax=Phyllobacterium salinisoli TaxID=1899321 RepID=A0A368KBQ5_9HYPH|nr:OmpA family protein [Phyllobacterium salinisoli]